MPPSDPKPLRSVRGRTLWFGYGALLVFAVASFAAGVFEPISSTLYDHHSRVLQAVGDQETESDVVVVGLDEDTVKSHPEPLTLWHAHFGRLLTSLGELSPSLIVWDIVLPDKSYAFLSPDYDRALLSGILAAKKETPLVVAQTLDSGGRPRKLFPPIVSLAGEDSVGLSVVPADPDGTVRRVDATVQEQAPTLYGRATEKLGLEPRDSYINYTVGSPFSYVPMQRVLAASDAQSSLRPQFAGKVVLVGAILPFDDRHPVPVALAAFEPENRHVPGVLVQAQALRAALQGVAVSPVGPAAQLVLLLLVSLAWWFRYSLTSALLVLASGLLILYAIGLHGLGQQQLYLPLGSVAAAFAAAVAGRLGLETAGAFRQRREYERSFARYVSPDVLREILAGRIKPEMQPERRKVCVLFSDIRSFTTRSEKELPEVTINFLNEYFEEMVAAVHAHGGTIDKFIGDGLMTFFGAPGFSGNPIPDAFASAMEMLERLDRLNDRLESRGLEPVAIGVGLHAGEVVIGHVGSAARHEYTIIGDTVNTASRLEGLTKALGYPIVCSNSVAEEILPTTPLTDLGVQAVKGRAPLQVYGWRPTPPVGGPNEP